MQLIYAYVYYFLLGFGALNFLLVLFVFKPMRKLLHKVQTKFQNVFDNQYIGYAINFSFAIIFLILADSIRTFYLLHQHLDERSPAWI